MRAVLAAVPLVALVLLASWVACSKQEPERARNETPRTTEIAPGAASADAAALVDPQVLAFLSEARALHHRANVYEAANDPASAAAALEQLTQTAKPHPGTVVPEVEEVLSDTYARLAELRLRAGNFDGAARDIQDGLNHAKEPTYFRGHLFEVAGIVEEARALSLADAGRAADSTRARDRALSLLHEAVEIQNKVITGATAP